MSFNGNKYHERFTVVSILLLKITVNNFIVVFHFSPYTFVQ